MGWLTLVRAPAGLCALSRPRCATRAFFCFAKLVSTEVSASLDSLAPKDSETTQACKAPGWSSGATPPGETYFRAFVHSLSALYFYFQYTRHRLQECSPFTRLLDSSEGSAKGEESMLPGIAEEHLGCTSAIARIGGR